MSPHAPPYREPTGDHDAAVARAFIAAAHREALQMVAATDAVWLKRDAVAVPERP